MGTRKYPNSLFEKRNNIKRHNSIVHVYIAYVGNYQIISVSIEISADS